MLLNFMKLKTDLSLEQEQLDGIIRTLTHDSTEHHLENLNYYYIIIANNNN
jgi:hypothetical protein